MKTFLTLLINLASYAAFACRVDAPANLNLFTNLESKESFFIKDNSPIQNPVLNAGNCEQTAITKKALLITVGVEQYGLEDAKRSLSFSGEYNEDKCTISNAPFPLLSYSEKLKFFKRKNDYLKKCIEVVVNHKSVRPLAYSPIQKGCIIEKLGTHQARFQGGFCFFKPNPDSQFQFSLNIKESCRSVDGMEKLFLGPQEMTGAINFYIAGDDSGNSPDLTAIKSTPFNVSIDPLSSLMPLAFHNGQTAPRWPGQWVFPDIYLTNPIITSENNNQLKIKIPLLVNNNCPTKCDQNICSSPCSYSLPVAGEFTLKDVTSGKEIFLSNWYDGGIAPANWQGLIRGQGQILDKTLFTKGKKFQLDFFIQDPKIDFDIFKNKIKKRFGSINSNTGPILPGEIVGTINTIPEININNGALPNISTINPSIGSPLGDLDAALNNFNSKLSLGNWPPLYEEACSNDLDNCKRSTSFIIKYRLTFQVDNVESNGLPHFSYFEWVRESPFSQKISKQSDQLPQLICQ